MDSIISVDHPDDLLWEQRQRDLRALEGGRPDLSHQHCDAARHNMLRRSVQAAVKKGDLDSLMAALAECCNSERSPLPVILEQKHRLTGDTLLHVAAASASDGVLRLIIAHFSDQQIMARNRWGDTALHVAASSKNLAVVKLLVQRARQIWESKDKDHDWVLLWAKNNTGNTPLHKAVVNRRESIVECLLDEDQKSLFWQNKQGKSALYLAVETGDLGILNLLLAITLEEGEDFASKVGGMSPVHAAIMSQRLDMMKAMKEKKPRLFQAKEFGGYNALHLAVFTNFTKGVKFLLQEFQSLAFEYDEDGYQPIHVACKRSPISMIWQLLEDCENPGDFLTREGQNIAHVSAKYGRNYVVMRMMTNPKIAPLITKQDDCGNTALHIAVAYLQPMTVLSLLAWDPRAKIALLNNECQAPMDILRMQMSEGINYPRHQWTTYQVLAGAGARGSPDLVVCPRDKYRGWSFRRPWKASILKENINTHLIVATLIATVTFAAGFTVPGGFYGSDSPNKGLALLANKCLFKAFVISDTVALYCSLLAIVFLLWSLLGEGDPHPYFMSYMLSVVPLRLALAAMVVAFSTGVSLVVQNHPGFQKDMVDFGKLLVILIFIYSMMPLTPPCGLKLRFLWPLTFFWFHLAIMASGGWSRSPILKKEEEERRLSKGGQLESSPVATGETG